MTSVKGSAKASHIIKDGLPERLCTSLRAYVNSETSREHYKGGYEALDFWYDSSPLFSQLLRWVQTNIPTTRTLRCKRCWFFKYDTKCEGVPIHADDGEVTVNIWLTPNESIIDPDKNGLVMYDSHAPQSWSFEDFNGDVRKIRRHLRRTRATHTVIPYAYRRIIVFPSRTFHQTNGVHTKHGSRHRRINCTILFGA